MTDQAARLAELHLACFGSEAAHGWTAKSLAKALHDPSMESVLVNDAFAFARVALDEAELLLIGTSPKARGRGRAKMVLSHLQDQLRARGILRLFLEVAADNTPARALYASLGYQKIGCRRAYYHGIDALLLERHPL